MNNNMPQYQNAGYTGKGYLVVRVSAASETIPLEGATVLIRGGEENDSAVIARLTSGSDGLTPKIALAAPPRILSESPGNIRPFATYNVDVHLKGYPSVSAQNVPIFDGITSVQSVTMIPLPKNGYPDAFTPFGTRYTESISPNL